ncbi:MAG TPA: hypothetical protein ENG98_02590 [Actinobacteria bacterium]|nr:hypothetical protein BMS3Bbin02_02067 [bacterium BMS3Bbin02]HDL41886.1 hypothetical protein [Actinomycetota bacterium]
MVLIRRWMAMVVALVLVAAACSGSTLTASEYFDQINALTEELDQAMDDLGATYEADLNTSIDTLRIDRDMSDPSELAGFMSDLTDVAIAKTVVWLDGTEAPLRAFLASLEEMNPPEDVQLAHNSMVTATQNALAVLPDTTAQVRTVGTAVDLAVVVENSPFAEATGELQNACLALQTVATDKTIDVQIDCGMGSS